MATVVHMSTKEKPPATIDVFLGAQEGVAVVASLAPVRDRWEVVTLTLSTFAPGMDQGVPVPSRWPTKEPIASEPRALTSDDLRRVKLLQVRADCHRAAIEAGMEFLAGVELDVADQLRESAGVRRQLDRDFYLEIARVYFLAWAHVQNPVKTLHAYLNDPDSALYRPCSLPTARRYVQVARNDFGFLEAATERKAEGRLTKKAQRLLEKKDRGGTRGTR